MSVKDIDLPAVNDKQAKYSLILDNGIHCISTPYKQLSRTSYLDQEFELTVGEELEFILTLKTKYPKAAVIPRKPVPSHLAPVSSQSTTSSASVRARHGLSRLFGAGSKKRAVNQIPPPSMQTLTVESSIRKDPWDLVTAPDGSFARAYIAFSQYEKEICGKPATFEIPCFNEWAKNSADASKRQPYKVGKIQVQMMFVPRASKNETLPQSIKAALEELREARKTEPVSKDGFLSQLGGDCKYWRRRYFKLDGLTLVAYSELSRKPRATINLAKAIRVIEDKSSLTEPVVVVGNSRRKSAFAEQEEAFMFVEEGFRIRFGNGEIIDFYADSKEVKQEWMTVLTKAITTSTKRSPWVELILRQQPTDKVNQ
jgi:hypothetical protein